MKLSARNILKGTITEVTKGAVNGIVVIECCGTKIKSDITNEAIESLGLEVGQEAYAIVKATNVMIATDEEGLTKLSARNQLPGTVAEVKKGAVNGHVTIDVDGSDAKVKASITNDAIESLDLKVGDKAMAIIKATDVLVGID